MKGRVTRSCPRLSCGLGLFRGMELPKLSGWTEQASNLSSSSQMTLRNVLVSEPKDCVNFHLNRRRLHQPFPTAGEIKGHGPGPGPVTGTGEALDVRQHISSFLEGN